MRSREERRVRKAQMEALDQLSPALRKAIYDAPANFDPRRILIKYRTYGEKDTLRDIREQMDELWAMYYDRLEM